MVWIILLLAGFALAYSNGANDNFKGVATLFGSKTTSYRKAITWATITTFAGSVAAAFLASKLVHNFSGKGLIPGELILDPNFAIAIAMGAALTVFGATFIGMPISTTHSLVGALFGAGVVAVWSEFNFTRLIDTFLFPLFMSPLMAATGSFILYIIFRQFRRLLNISKSTCVCVGKEVRKAEMVSNSHGTAEYFLASSNGKVKVHDQDDCFEAYEGRFLYMNAQTLLDKCHFLSAGVVSFSRGLNDTPKIAGLLLIVPWLQTDWALIVLGLVIAAGGLLHARKVGETVSNRITSLNHGQGFTANLITGLLVTTASVHGLPVSTTHVSVGSIFGIGVANGKANKKVVGKILLSWLVTLPVAALLSGVVYFLLQ